MALFGVAFGRLVCALMCPFGLLQEILHFPVALLEKKFPGLERFQAPAFLRKAKVVILAALVVILPLFALDEFGYGAPWFCKYVCPSGTIGGALPLMLADSRLAGMRGALFWMKVAIAVFVALGSVCSHRFFCKFMCPLGAFYGFFNKISFYRMSCGSRCNECGVCQKVCRMGVDPQ
jgi:polyferredoxin